MWYTFPYDAITGHGLAARASRGSQRSPSSSTSGQNPAKAGRDASDLSNVGLPCARYVQVEGATHFQTPDRLCADPDGIVAPFTSYLLVASYTSDPDNEGEILGSWEYLGQATKTDLFTLFSEHTLPLSRSDEKGGFGLLPAGKEGGRVRVIFLGQPTRHRRSAGGRRAYRRSPGDHP